MRDQFWQLVTAIRYREYYGCEYRKSARKHKWIIVLCCTLVSAICLGLLPIIPSNLTFIVIFIGLLAQACHIVIPMLPFDKRISYLRFFIPQLRRLANEADMLWNECCDSEEKHLECIRSLLEKFTALEEFFIGDDDIPDKDKLHNETRKKWSSYYNAF